jgi:hypothetical protein
MNRVNENEILRTLGNSACGIFYALYAMVIKKNIGQEVVEKRDSGWVEA